MTLPVDPVPGAQRARQRLRAVPGRRRPVADLRRDAGHQHGPRLALHARHLSRLHDRDGGRRRARLLGRRRSRGTRRRGDRRGDRDAAAAPHLSCARAVPAARDLRARARDQRRDAVAVGTGGPARPARAGPARCRRHPRPPLSELRPDADRGRARRAADPASRAVAHAVRPAGAGGDPGPRHGRRARRQPGAAVHRRVHRGLLPRRARRRAAARPRARQSRHGPHRARRRLRGRGRRRHGLDSRRLSRRGADRRDQGAVHQHRHRSFRRLRRRISPSSRWSPNSW